MGKRIHLCEYETGNLVEGLNSLFDREVEIPRMRFGKKQTLDMPINEEAFLAKYLRNEKQEWDPRFVTIRGNAFCKDIRVWKSTQSNDVL